MQFSTEKSNETCQAAQDRFSLICKYGKCLHLNNSHLVRSARVWFGFGSVERLTESCETIKSLTLWNTIEHCILVILLMPVDRGISHYQNDQNEHMEQITRKQIAWNWIRSTFVWDVSNRPGPVSQRGEKDSCLNRHKVSSGSERKRKRERGGMSFFMHRHEEYLSAAQRHPNTSGRTPPMAAHTCGDTEGFQGYPTPLVSVASAWMSNS